MGGRGASSGISRSSSGNFLTGGGVVAGGAGGGTFSFQQLMNGDLPNGGIQTQTLPQKGDYDGGGNPALIKWQQQTDEDKAAAYLAKLSKSTDEITKITDDKWGFYNNPMQKMLLNMGLNDKPTILSSGEFDALAQKTGAEVMYRGWGKKEDIPRFEKANYAHIGTGRYGDGLYFGSLSIASGYGSPKSVCMLSPNARVIDVATLRSMMPSTGKLAAALRYSGTTGDRQYLNDVGGEAQWALKMGYNVIDAGWCKCVLTRDALIVRGK